MRITNVLILPLACFLAVLVGCSSELAHQDLQDYIAETKRRPKGTIDPLPSFRPYRSFTYSAMTLRSPFEKPMKEEQKTVFSSGKDVVPDLSREREYLESFNFGSLMMVGTIYKDGTLWALISDGQGGVHRVKKGNYLGKNHGRIMLTANGQVEVVEIVSDGLKGWLERPRTLTLEEKE